jgi:hypothetical protein
MLGDVGQLGLVTGSLNGKLRHRPGRTLGMIPPWPLAAARAY